MQDYDDSKESIFFDGGLLSGHSVRTMQCLAGVSRCIGLQLRRLHGPASVEVWRHDWCGQRSSADTQYLGCWNENHQ